MDFLRKLNERIERRSRWLGLGMAIVVLVAACYFARGDFWKMAAGTALKNESRVVVIDAGHGGSDPGKIGVDGTQEKVLNLAMAHKLKLLLEQQDIQVIMTRETDDGLYDANASNKKSQDMKRRCELINEVQPACVISIHQNSYHEEAINGAQVFYYGNSSESERLAKLIQEELVSFVDPENHRKAKANETYYLLKKTQVPVVIVECGFLSNWEESKKLQDENYQDELMWAVSMGTQQFMNGSGN